MRTELLNIEKVNEYFGSLKRKLKREIVFYNSVEEGSSVDYFGISKVEYKVVANGNRGYSTLVIYKLNHSSVRIDMYTNKGKLTFKNLLIDVIDLKVILDLFMDKSITVSNITKSKSKKSLGVTSESNYYYYLMINGFTFRLHRLFTLGFNGVLKEMGSSLLVHHNSYYANEYHSNDNRRKYLFLVDSHIAHAQFHRLSNLELRDDAFYNIDTYVRSEKGFESRNDFINKSVNFIIEDGIIYLLDESI